MSTIQTSPRAIADAKPSVGSPGDFDLRQTVLAALDSDEANPHAIAERLANELEWAVLRDVVRRTLPQYVLGVIHSQRAGRNLQKPSTAKEKASRKWASVKEHQDSGDLDIYRQRMSLSPDGKSWKFLGDCSIRDIKTLASLRQELADKNRAKAKRFEALADHMQTNQIPTVAGVDTDDLRGLLDVA